METALYTLSLVAIALACLLAIFTHKFDDNLFQRVGLSLACLGSGLRLFELFDYVPNDTQARYLFTYGVALFCTGTTWKFWRKP